MVYTYAPENCSLIVAGFKVTGFLEDKLVEIKQAGDYFVTSRTADGKISRVNRKSDYFTITVNLQFTSPSNTMFGSWLAADRLTSAGQLPVFFKDNSTGTTITALEAYVLKQPQTNRSRGMESMEWEICLPESVVINNSEEQNSILSAIANGIGLSTAFADNFGIFK